MKDAITIIKNNKIKTVIEMKERVIDFVVVCSSPWISGKDFLNYAIKQLVP